MPLAPGQSIAGCRILSECGRGAYGTVYLAEDALGRRVAVKLLPETADGDYELKGLRNFIGVCSSSPALMTVFLCGREADSPFYVMEAADDAAETPGGQYIPDTLALRLERQKRIPPKRHSPSAMNCWTAWRPCTTPPCSTATSSRKTSSS